MSFIEIYRVISALIVAVALPASGFGQTGSSAILGFVKDGTGAALPGATVRVINVETGVAVELTTNGEGVYRASALVPGHGPHRDFARGFEDVDEGPRHTSRSARRLPSTSRLAWAVSRKR